MELDYGNESEVSDLRRLSDASDEHRVFRDRPIAADHHGNVLEAERRQEHDERQHRRSFRPDEQKGVADRRRHAQADATSYFREVQPGRLNDGVVSTKGHKRRRSADRHRQSMDHSGRSYAAEPFGALVVEEDGRVAGGDEDVMT